MGMPHLDCSVWESHLLAKEALQRSYFFYDICTRNRHQDVNNQLTANNVSLYLYRFTYFQYKVSEAYTRIHFNSLNGFY